VLLDEVLQAALLKVLSHVLLHVEHDLGTTGKLLTVVGDHCKSAASVGLPLVLLVIVVLRDDNDLLSDQVGRVETHTELANHTDVSAGRDGLHEGASAGLGNRTQVVDQIGLLHTDTTVDDGQGVVGAVRDDSDLEVGLTLELLGLSDRLVADLVEGIGGVGDKLSKEDLLVRVESVDDERHQLLDVGIECKDFFGQGDLP